MNLEVMISEKSERSEDMELTINLEDLSQLVIKSSSGTSYRILPEETVENLIKEIEQLAAKTRKTLVTQRELREIKGVGHSTIKQWVAMGLSEIPDGNKIYYDLEELDQLLKSKKI